MCVCTCSLSFFPHLKKLIWKSFEAPIARRFTDYAWIPWSVFSHHGSRKLMKMHLHTHELRHTWNCFLSVCYCFSLSVCLWLLLSWPLQSGANTKTWRKHCFSTQLQRPAVSEAQMIVVSEIPLTQLQFRKPVRIPCTKVSCVALYWAEFSNAVSCCCCFVLFFTRTTFINFCVCGGGYNIERDRWKQWL